MSAAVSMCMSVRAEGVCQREGSGKEGKSWCLFVVVVFVCAVCVAEIREDWKRDKEEENSVPFVGPRLSEVDFFEINYKVDF